MSKTQKGWYQSPTVPSVELFWNGKKWTGEVRPRVGGTDSDAAPSNASRYSTPDNSPPISQQSATAFGESGAVASPPPSTDLSFRTLKDLPLWLKLTLPAVVLVLVILLVVTIVQPRDGALAEAECRSAAIDAMLAPSEASIATIEVRLAPENATKDAQWVQFISTPVADGTLDQAKDFDGLLKLFYGDNHEDGVIRPDGPDTFKPHTYFAVGKIDGTNGFGGVVRQSFICGVVVDGTDVQEMAKLAFFG